MIALRDIFLGNGRYRRGETLPSGTGLEEDWIEAGSACTEEEYAAILAGAHVKAKAKRGAAKAGLPGAAVPSSGEDLVGQVPKKGRRGKRGSGL